MKMDSPANINIKLKSCNYSLSSRLFTPQAQLNHKSKSLYTVNTKENCFPGEMRNIWPKELVIIGYYIPELLVEAQHGRMSHHRPNEMHLSGWKWLKSSKQRCWWWLAYVLQRKRDWLSAMLSHTILSWIQVGHHIITHKEQFQSKVLNSLYIVHLRDEVAAIFSSI